MAGTYVINDNFMPDNNGPNNRGVRTLTNHVLAVQTSPVNFNNTMYRMFG